METTNAAAATANDALAHADLTLSVYLEELASERRVLWLGDASSEAPQRLAAVARSVRVLTTSAQSPRKRRGGPSFSRLEGGPLRFDAGAFDLIVVPELGVLDDLGARLGELQTSLDDDGVLIVGTAAEAGVGYERLQGLVAEAFGSARMFGQARFTGWAVADLSAPAESVVVDGSLAEETAPLRYFALCGASDVDGYTLVQVPDMARAVAAAPTIDPGFSAGGTVELDAAHQHAEELEIAVAERTREIESLRSELERARDDKAEAHVRLESLQQDAARLREAQAAVQSAAAARVATPPKASLEDEYSTLEGRLEERGHRVMALEAEVLRRATLVRDLVEELRDARGGRVEVSPTEQAVAAMGATAPDSQLVARLADAEAIRQEAVFFADELAAELDSHRLEEAALLGRVRGLEARAAELVELREVAEARLELARQDVAAGADKEHGLERELAKVREALELSMLQAKAPAEPQEREDEEPYDGPDVSRLAASEQRLSARVSELSTQLIASRDLVAELERSGAPAPTSDVDDEAVTRAQEAAARAETQCNRLSTRVADLSRKLEASQQLVAELERAADVPQVEEAPEPSVTIEPEEPDESVFASERRLSARVGELSLQLSASQDLVTKAGALSASLETRLEGMRLGYETRIAMIAGEKHDGSAVPSDSPELRRLSGQLGMLRGEREALRARLADREAELARKDSVPLTAPSLNATLDELDALRGELESLRAEHSAVVIQHSDADRGRSDAVARVADLGSAVASRDALVTRLQMDLAEEEQSARVTQEQSSRLAGENQRLRSALVDASEAVDGQARYRDQAAELVKTLDKVRHDLEAAHVSGREAGVSAEALRAQVTRLEGQLEASRAAEGDTEHTAELESKVGSLEAEVASVVASVDVAVAEAAEHRAALEAARNVLAALELGEGSSAASPEITSVGSDAPSVDAAEVQSLQRELGDRDTLLRSLTAQLEERNERLRALELSSASRPTSPDQALQGELVDLQSLVASLQEDLTRAREARRDAEADTPSGAESEEVRKLRETLRERYAEVLRVRTQAEAAERDGKVIRDAIGETKGGLEELLASATQRGDATTADRLGGLIRLLGKY